MNAIQVNLIDMNAIQVNLIDDDQAAHELFCALKNINGFSDEVGMNLAEALQTGDKSLPDCVAWCRAAIQNSGERIIVFLLDLQLELRPALTPAQEGVTEDYLGSTYGTGNKMKQGWSLAAHVHTGWTLPAGKNVLWYIQTTGTAVPSVTCADPSVAFATCPANVTSLSTIWALWSDRVAQYFNGGISIATMRNSRDRSITGFLAVVGSIFGSDQESIQGRIRRWRLHEDESIASVLNEYGEPIRRERAESIASVLNEYGEPIRRERAGLSTSSWSVWHHNWCQEEIGRIHGNRICKAIVPGDALSNAGNKGLHLLDRENNSFSFSERERHPISREQLTSALTRLKINATVTAGCIQLPVEPGLAFLLSLRELVWKIKMCKDPDLRLIEFSAQLDANGQANSYALRICLDPKGQKHGFEHVTRMLQKMGDSGAGIPNSGFSGAIWNLASCRIAEVKNPDNEAWVEMFRKGVGRWVAWPSLEENAIVLRWGTHR